MFQFRINYAFILLMITSWMQIDDILANNDCVDFDKAPKFVKEIFDEVKPFAYLLQVEVNENETRRCCGIYGCFSTQLTFGNGDCQKLTVLPSCQDELQIKYYLWTNENSNSYNVIDPEDEQTLVGFNMNSNSSIVIYINGFLGTGNMSYIQKIKDAMLNRDQDIMFFSVEWVKGSRTPYARALANSLMVGAVTAHLIQQLQKLYGISPEKIHIIGVNIGSRAAGAVGKRIPGIGRITGLDPVGWGTHNCPGISGISMTDAIFVDIIHTNSRTYGTLQPKGHLDIYINGALEQPACRGCLGCNHTIVVLYFLKSIEKTFPYFAFQCDSYDNFLRGKCSEGCGSDRSLCAPMGYYSHEWKCHSGMSPTLMYISMGINEAHFHLYHYHVEIGCMDDKYRLWRYGRNLDKLEIKLIGANKTDTGFQEVYAESIAYTTEPRITAVITSEHQIEDITNVILKWTPHTDKTIPEKCESLTNDCSIEKEHDCTCLECPFKLKYLVVKNLETGRGTRFDDINKSLPVNKKLSITCGGE